jgi:hypothetical protein
MIDRSSRARMYVAALVVASLLLPVQPGRADSSQPASSLPALYVNYTMNCTFTMTDDAGKTLTSVSPGGYQILVTSPVPFAAVDLAGINDTTACKGFAQFALSGPGVSVTTTMDNGDSDNAVLYATFAPSSTYTAVDNIQPAVAHFSFTTTAAAPPSVETTTATTTTAQAKAPTVVGGSSASAPAAPAVSSPDRGTLAATVSGTGAVALTDKGKAVTTLRAGRYTIVVIDASRRTGFVVQQTHGATTWLSTGAFTGKRTRSIDLTKGQWSFSASPAGAKTWFIVLS